jgi:fibronectin-binding autotransporter adhesin
VAGWISARNLIASGGTLIVNSLVSAQAITISGGGITLNFDGVAATSSFTLSGGALAGTATLRVANQFSWSGGDMTTNAGRTELAAGVTGTITGTNVKRLGRIFDNRGSITYSGSLFGFGPITGSVGVFNNLPGASFTAHGDGDITPWYTSSSHAFNNQGAFIRTGPGVTSIGSVPFSSSGPVSVQAGTLALLGGGTHTATGDFAVAAGATLELGGNHTLPTGADITGNGSLHVSSGTSAYQGSVTTTGDLILVGGTLTVAGSVSVANLTASGGALTVNGVALATATTISGGGITLNAGATTSSFTQSGGTLAGDATLNVESQLSWSGGDMTTNSGRTLLRVGATGTITGTNVKRLGRVFDNGGNITYSGSLFGFGPIAGSVGVFNNLPGASFTVNGDGNMGVWYASTSHVFSNAGTFTRMGTGDTTIDVALNSGGPVNVQAGTLALNAGGTHTASGDFAVAAGATLQLGGNHTLPGGSDINGNGSLRVASGTSTYQGSLNTTGDLLLAGGTLTIAGSVTVANLGATSGTVIVNGPISAPTINISSGGLTHNAAATTSSLTMSGGTLAGTGTLTVSNQFSWSGGDMTTNAGRTVLAAGVTGTITGTNVKRLGRVLDNDGNITYSGSAFGFGPIAGSFGVFNNLAGGGFVASGDGDIGVWYTTTTHAFNNLGTFTRLGGGDTVISGANFTNNGTVIVHEGTLRLDAGFANFVGQTLFGGSYTIRGTFQFYGADIRTNDAGLELDGPGARIVSHTGADGLANLSFNTNVGNLTLRNGHTLITEAGLMNHGAVAVHAGSLLAAAGYLQTAGTTTLSGFGGLYVADTVSLQGGLLTGQGFVHGNLVNAARIDVGGAGTAGLLLVLGGSYTQTAAGVLNIDVGGPAAMTQHDMFYVQGGTSLAGTLNVTRTGGYMPAPGDYVFPLLSEGPTNGTFGSITGLPIGGGRELLPYYFGNGLLLYAV